MSKLFQLNKDWYLTTDFQTYLDVMESNFDKEIMERKENYDLNKMSEEEYLFLEEKKYLELYESSVDDRKSKILWEEETEYLLDSKNEEGFDLNNEEDIHKFNSKYDTKSREVEIDTINEVVLFQEDKNNQSYNFGEDYESEVREVNKEVFNNQFDNTELNYIDVSNIMFRKFIMEVEEKYDFIIKEVDMRVEGYYDKFEDKIYVNTNHGLTSNKEMMEVILHLLSFSKEKTYLTDILENIDFKYMIEKEEEDIQEQKRKDEEIINMFEEEKYLYD